MNKEIILTRLSTRLEHAARYASKFEQQIKSKGIRYWLTALIILVLAATGSSYVYNYLGLTQRRSDFFQWLLEKGPRPPTPNFVKLVLINDDEYWRGDLAGRRPIKRDYLAKLVTNIAGARANLIALDFDTRLPNPQLPRVPKDYEGETADLIDAIRIAAKGGVKIVLATALSFNQRGEYQREPDIYQLAGFCKPDAASAVDEIAKNVTCGYIALPRDPLVIPGPLKLADGSTIDSFGVAIARAQRPILIGRVLSNAGANAGYGNFISKTKFEEFGAVLSAAGVREGKIAELDKLRGAPVIIGAHWSTFASGKGAIVDQHWTPIGRMVGAVLHANFAEALLDSRTFTATPEWALHGTEIILSLLAAIALAVIPSVWGKLVGFALMILILLAAQWAALHGFAVFFDIFVPLVGLALHALYERLAGVHPAAASNPDAA